MAQGDDAMEAEDIGTHRRHRSPSKRARRRSFRLKAAAAEPFYPQQPYKSDPKYQRVGTTTVPPNPSPRSFRRGNPSPTWVWILSVSCRTRMETKMRVKTPASPLSKQRRQAVVQQLESGMSGQHPQHEDYHHQQYPDNGEYYDEGAYHHGGYHPAAHYPSQTYGAGYDGAHYHQHAKAYAHRHQHDREYGVVADGEWSGAGWEGAHGRGR